MSFDIIEFREIRYTLFVTKQVFGSHHYKRLAEVPVYLQMDVSSVCVCVKNKRIKLQPSIHFGLVLPVVAEHGNSWQV